MLHIALVYVCFKYKLESKHFDLADACMYQYKQCQTSTCNNLTLYSKVKVTVTLYLYTTLLLVLMHICTKYKLMRLLYEWNIYV